MLREAKRPAFATSFESTGQAGAFIAEQWRLKGLDLVAVPGESDEDRGRNLLLFLDRLADRVASATPRLLLAPDAVVSGAMARLRGLLLEAGEEVIGLCRGPDPGSLEVPELGPVADVLKLLADQGWRPAGVSRTTLCRLWERVADFEADSTERRRWLVEALRAAEGADEARRVRMALANLEGPGKRPGG